MKKKIVTLLCLLLSFAMCFSLVACDILGGDGDGDGNKMGAAEVEKMNSGLTATQDYEGSYTISEIGNIDIVVEGMGENMNETVSTKAYVGYNAANGNFYLNGQVSAYDEMVDVTLFTKKMEDGSFNQYAYMDGEGMFMNFPTVASLKEDGTTYPNSAGDEVSMYIESLGEALESFYLVDLDDAADISDPNDYADYWMEQYGDDFEDALSSLTEMLEGSGATVKNTVNKPSVTKKGGETIYAFGIEQNASMRESAQGMTASMTYSMAIDFEIALKDGKLSGIAVDVDADMDVEMNGQSYMTMRVDGSTDTTFDYTYDASHELTEAQMEECIDMTPDRPDDGGNNNGGVDRPDAPEGEPVDAGDVAALAQAMAASQAWDGSFTLYEYSTVEQTGIINMNMSTEGVIGYDTELDRFFFDSKAYRDDALSAAMTLMTLGAGNGEYVEYHKQVGFNGAEDETYYKHHESYDCLINDGYEYPVEINGANTLYLNNCADMITEFLGLNFAGAAGITTEDAMLDYWGNLLHGMMMEGMDISSATMTVSDLTVSVEGGSTYYYFSSTLDFTAPNAMTVDYDGNYILEVRNGKVVSLTMDYVMSNITSGYTITVACDASMEIAYEYDSSYEIPASEYNYFPSYSEI